MTEFAVARGLYRWLEEEGGAEIWRARIDRASGDWITLSEEQYVIEGCVPDFWTLPLKDDYLAELPGQLLGGDG